MYKVKIVFLYEDSKANCTWSHQWVNCNDPKEIGEIVPAYHEKEAKALKEDNIDKDITHVIVVDIQDISKGDYVCDSCGCYQIEPEDGFCPYCDSSIVLKVDETDEPAPKKFSGPRLAQ
jgi:hypothetical protein